MKKKPAMKKNKVMHTSVCILLTTIIIMLIPSNLALGLDKFQIVNTRPKANSKVETMNVVLSVKILSNEEPLPYAWVNFYIDDVWIDGVLTDSVGFAHSGVSSLDEFGSHTWQVRLNKQGWETKYSTVWKFNYQPRPVLTLYSDYGEVYGEGNYTYGEKALFGLNSSVININETKRLVFIEWKSYQDHGYSGHKSDHNITMVNDVSEHASWKTQYYLNMSCDLPQVVVPKSGWYDEGDIVGIRVDPPYGIEFLYWSGSGNGSYNGTDTIQSIHINGPVSEEAFFKRDNFSLTVESEYGNSFGSGVYPAWENVSFGVDSEYIYLGDGVRLEFTGWKSNSSDGYKGNLTETVIALAKNLLQTAVWRTQYYVNIGSSEGGNATTPSGWVDENTEIKLETIGQENYTFVGWEGEGQSSYSGPENSVNLIVQSPVDEIAKWKRVFSLQIESDLPVEGEGEYLEGTTVSIKANPSQGLLVRKVFKQWSGDVDSTNNPFTFSVTRDMEISAVYVKNYTYVLGIALVLMVVIGVLIYRMLD